MSRHSSYGAIGPRHDWHKHSTIDAFTDTYRKQMVRAIGHLQRWCDTSRMSFGAKKTQLVIFSGRQKGPDRSNYEDSQALRLCGFSIAIAPSYRYLGLHLHQHQLSWVIRGCRVYGRWTGWCRERWGLFGWPLLALQWRQRVEGNSRLSVCVCESLSVSQCDCVAWVDE